MHPAVPVQVVFPRFQLLVDGPSVTDGPSATNVVTHQPLSQGTWRLQQYHKTSHEVTTVHENCRIEHLIIDIDLCCELSCYLCLGITIEITQWVSCCYAQRERVSESHVRCRVCTARVNSGERSATVLVRAKVHSFNREHC